jgi:hypothetical protein
VLPLTVSFLCHAIYSFGSWTEIFYKSGVSVAANLWCLCQMYSPHNVMLKETNVRHTWQPSYTALFKFQFFATSTGHLIMVTRVQCVFSYYVVGKIKFWCHNEYASGTSAEGHMAEELKLKSFILYTINPTGTLWPISITGQSEWDSWWSRCFFHCVT